MCFTRYWTAWARMPLLKWELHTRQALRMALRWWERYRNYRKATAYRDMLCKTQGISLLICLRSFALIICTIDAVRLIWCFRFIKWLHYIMSIGCNRFSDLYILLSNSLQQSLKIWSNHLTRSLKYGMMYMGTNTIWFDKLQSASFPAIKSTC